MSEKSYSVGHKYIRFSEDNDEFPCLCTFPHNDREQLDISRLQSLVLFGAVAQLVLKDYYSNHEGEYIFIPQDVPAWILRDVRSLTPRAADVACRHANYHVSEFGKYCLDCHQIVSPTTLTPDAGKSTPKKRSGK